MECKLHKVRLVYWKNFIRRATITFSLLKHECTKTMMTYGKKNSLIIVATNASSVTCLYSQILCYNPREGVQLDS